MAWTPSFGLVLATAIALAAPSTQAQQLQPTGHLLRSITATYTRGSLGQSASELIQRFDADDLRGFGVESAFPGVHVVRGATLGIVDYAGSTPNPQCDVTLYTEDPARPGFPDLTAPLGGVTGIDPGIGLFQFVSIGFPTAVLAPVGRDLFLGVRIPATTSPYWGVRMLFLPGGPGTVTFDRAGPALPTSPPEANSYCLTRDLTTNDLTYEPRGQYLVDLLTTSPSGMASALTNQASWQVSILEPGGTSMLSGLHPDASNAPLNPGRADDVAFVFRDAESVLGWPVVFLGAFADFGPTVPLDQFVPGSVGGSCLDPTASFAMSLRFLNGSLLAAHVTTIPPAARAMIQGLSWTQQAIGLDLNTGTLRGSQCVKQHF